MLFSQIIIGVHFSFLNNNILISQNVLPGREGHSLNSTEPAKTQVARQSNNHHKVGKLTTS